MPICVLCGREYIRNKKESRRGVGMGLGSLVGAYCSHECYAKTISLFPHKKQIILPQLSDVEIAWIAGLLEGEGSFLMPPPSSPKQIRISVHMTDADVLKKYCVLVGAKNIRVMKQQKENHKKSYRVDICGDRAKYIMEKILPHMGERRTSRIMECINLVNKNEKAAQEARERLISNFNQQICS